MSTSLMFIIECLLTLYALTSVVSSAFQSLRGSSQGLDTLRLDLAAELDAWQCASQEAWQRNLAEAYAYLSSHYPSKQVELGRALRQLHASCDDPSRRVFTVDLLSQDFTCVVVRGRAQSRDRLRPNWHVRYEEE